MKERKNWGKFAGLGLHVLIGGLMIFTGSQKILGLLPTEARRGNSLGSFRERIVEVPQSMSLFNGGLP